MNDYSQFQIKVERIDVIKNTGSFKLIELQIIITNLPSKSNLKELENFALPNIRRSPNNSQLTCVGKSNFHSKILCKWNQQKFKKHN
jgi:hypothetical protein